MSEDRFEIGPDGLSQFERDAMRLARMMAVQSGRIRHEHDLKDIEHLAWEVAQDRRGNPWMVAEYAFRKWKDFRHLKESNRSVMSPKRQRGFKRNDQKPKRLTVRIALEFADSGEDPAELAAFNIDFDEWLKRLKKRERKLVKTLLKGLTTTEAAHRFCVSPGRISQMRRELEQKWYSQFDE